MVGLGRPADVTRDNALEQNEGSMDDSHENSSIAKEILDSPDLSRKNVDFLTPFDQRKSQATVILSNEREAVFYKSTESIDSKSPSSDKAQKTQAISTESLQMTIGSVKQGESLSDSGSETQSPKRIKSKKVNLINYCRTGSRMFHFLNVIRVASLLFSSQSRAPLARDTQRLDMDLQMQSLPYRDQGSYLKIHMISLVNHPLQSTTSNYNIG